MSVITTDLISERIAARGVDIGGYFDEVRQWDVKLTGPGAGRSELRAAGAMPVDDADVGPESDPDSEPDGPFGTRGYAAVFDSNSLPIYGLFTERIQRGAFADLLKTNPDVRLLVNHAGLAFARTTNNTLILREEPRGLYHESMLNPELDCDQELVARVDSGTVDQMSFSFRVARNGDVWSCKCGDPLGPDCRCSCDEIIRTLTQIDEMREVSVVTFPAYPATTVTATRASETDGEQTAQALDGEQREIQALEETSAQVDVSGPKEAREHRLAWITLEGEISHVSGYQGASRSEP